MVLDMLLSIYTQFRIVRSEQKEALGFNKGGIMAIIHKTAADVGMSPEGQAAWNESHTLDSGIAIIDFGSYPGSNEASVVVTGITTISATSKVLLFINADDTTNDHTANDHKYVGVFLNMTAGVSTAGVGFTIYATAMEKLQGTFKLHWLWSD
jgi:hypothetical protein